MIDDPDIAACERALTYIKMMRRGYDLTNVVFCFPLVKYDLSHITLEHITFGEHDSVVVEPATVRGIEGAWDNPSGIITGAIDKRREVDNEHEARAFSIRLPAITGVEFNVNHEYMKLFRENRCLTIHKRGDKYLCKVPGDLRDKSFALAPVPPFHRNVCMIGNLRASQTTDFTSYSEVLLEMQSMAEAVLEIGGSAKVLPVATSFHPLPIHRRIMTAVNTAMGFAPVIEEKNRTSGIVVGSGEDGYMGVKFDF